MKSFIGEWKFPKNTNVTFPKKKLNVCRIFFEKMNQKHVSKTLNKSTLSRNEIKIELEKNKKTRVNKSHLAVHKFSENQILLAKMPLFKAWREEKSMSLREDFLSSHKIFSEIEPKYGTKFSEIASFLAGGN